MPLVSDILDQLSASYAANPVQDSIKAMLIGKKGSGKSYAARTCRQPVLFHSFDPGGTKGLRQWIKTPANPTGYIIVDNRFEKEDQKAPNCYRLWENEMTRLKNNKVFEEIGTFYLDSLTMWGMAALNEIARANSRPGVYHLNDYNTLVQALFNWAQFFTELPCDVIITAHEETFKDEITGKVETNVYSIGQATRTRLPILFDEAYFAKNKPTMNGTEYQILTQNDGTCPASTRIGSGGKFEKMETLDFMALRKKAGLPLEHKQLEQKKETA